MALTGELITSFEALNITLNEQVLQKCEHLCLKYKIDPEDFVDQWCAYTASHLNGAPPTVDHLEKMERRELQKHAPITNKFPAAIPPKINIESDISVALERKETPEIPTPPSTLNLSVKFSQRSDSRSVQCEFGNRPDSFGNRGKVLKAFNVHVQNEEMDKCRYMYEKFLLKQKALNNITRYVASGVIGHNNLELLPRKLKDFDRDVVICGRICSDNAHGKLNSQSVMLEGLLDMYQGQRIKLKVDNVEDLSIFSGQTVVLQGSNMKSQFIANKIYQNSPLALPSAPTILLEDLHIILAAGPFTLPDNLLYEPLKDLLDYAWEKQPNFLILLGPFLDCDHAHVQNMNQSYDDFFHNFIVGGIMEKLDGSNVQVVLIPSPRDIHHHVIFPTPPYTAQKKHRNLIMAPNPAMLNIEGLLLGISSTDILFHIGKTEVFGRNSTDRMSRLVSHLLAQRSFYPLHPPDSDVCVDYQLVEKFAMWDKSPHLLFLPSNLRHFVKKVQNCVVVNPEKVVKGHTGCTFAHVVVGAGGGPVDERTYCQILKI